MTFINVCQMDKEWCSLFCQSSDFLYESNSDEFLFLNWEFIFLSYVSDVLIISSLLLSLFI